MDYNEAYQILNKNADSKKLFSFVLSNDNLSAIEYIKQITTCDDVVAKAILFDLSDGLITEKDNILNNEPIQLQTNIPKCPTCSSTNIQKIGTGERVASVAMMGIFSKKINKSFKCKHCGYTW